MRKLLTTTMSMVMLASLFSTGGCFVWKKDYDTLSAYNRRLQDQLENTETDLAGVEAEKQRLQMLLDEGGGSAWRVALLEQELREVNLVLDEMMALAKAQGQGPGPLPQFMNLALEQLAAQHSSMVEFVPSLGMIKFKADLTFPKGQDQLQPAALAALRELASIVGSAQASEFNVYVAGHTDDIPIKKPVTLERHPNNWYLSVHRAVMVEEALEDAGVAPQRLAIMGFGEYHPTAANAPGRKGNQANRRVEIWIVPPHQFLSGR